MLIKGWPWSTFTNLLCFWSLSPETLKVIVVVGSKWYEYIGAGSFALGNSQWKWSRVAMQSIKILNVKIVLFKKSISITTARTSWTQREQKICRCCSCYKKVPFERQGPVWLQVLSLSCCSLHQWKKNKVCKRVWWSIVVQPSPNLICNLPKPSKQSHQSVKTCWWPKESFYALCAGHLLLSLSAVLSFCTTLQSAIDW